MHAYRANVTAKTGHVYLHICVLRKNIMQSHATPNERKHTHTHARTHTRTY